MHPDIKTGQGTSTKNVWLDGGFWHEPSDPPTDCRTVRTWLRGEDEYRTGFFAHFGGFTQWVVNDDDGLPYCISADNIIGWQDIPQQAEPQPTSHDWPLMLFVAVLVLGVMYVGWHDARAGAAMLGGVAFGSVLGYAATRK